MQPRINDEAPEINPDHHSSIIAAIERTYTREGRDASGTYSIEGTRLVERAVGSGQAILRIALGQAFGGPERERLLLEMLPVDVEPQVLDEVDMQRLTGERDYGRIIALLSLPESTRLADRPVPPRVLLVADGIRDPGNMGAMIRTGLASWADGLLAIGVSDPWHPKAVRTSMGSLFKLPVYVADHASAAIEEVKDLGYTCIGSCPAGETDLSELQLDAGPVALFMGSESFGLVESVREQMDQRVRIPMPDGVDSFSVNAATAVLLHEIRKQGIPAVPGN
ncbi:MAG: RNA methyltransferase [Verrucomicrobiota bacterium]